MALYALENVDDAFDATRALLAPIDRTVWVKLAVVAFFLGTPGTGVGSFQSAVGGPGDGGPPPGQISPDLGPQEWLLIAAGVGGFVVLALAFALVGSIMEFVLVESLRRREVTIRRYWRRRWRQGVRLFGFRLVVGLFVAGSVVLLSGLLFLSVGGVDGGWSVALFVLFVPLFVVLALVVGLVDGFTTAFVVPIMVLEDCGVLDGWRRLWPTITDQWEQYLTYAVAGFVLSILGGILVGIATVVLAAILLIPLGIVVALGVGVFSVAEPFGIGLLVVGGLLFGLAVLVAAALAQVPVLTYLRYYALLVLGDVDPELDLVPELRAAIRRSPATEP